MATESSQKATRLQMGRVLIIAGSDPSGGAGIQADIKTVTMLRQYAATAVTAITVQDTCGVSDVLGLEPALVAAQIKAVLNDIGADAVKTGMLHSADIVKVVISAIEDSSWAGPLVVDPVMVATSGDRLVDDEALDIIRSELLPRASLVTPNLPEACVLTGESVSSVDDMKRVADKLLSLGPKAVLLKGGHLNAAMLTDLLVTHDGTFEISSEKITTPHTHGTGCTLASACAAMLAGGMNIEEAFHAAHAFVREAILKAPELGRGHGPLGHANVRDALPW
ncbi:bifunctional hydroxymethylpyrimidine kinase/phosphomethylpyrimidine kinase [Kordiimonas aquimaris]|uniref:bifunctional hydroxymethylpyrimidine kinase/phosphomethylpyrimidine kinase n=1 Tax=Kordiimonas aquimaris TaxID=707591 RepID=UPI0021D105A4|nr:bifunctional hydroxymethylpyrimidine kinase/phosphomethylpyrimidine kinase [Kordiimonas aquimaris]